LEELRTHFLENSIGGTKIAFGNFVKFGGRVIMHHGSHLIDEYIYIYIYIGIMHVIVEGVYFPIFYLDNDLPLCGVDDAIVILYNAFRNKPLHIINRKYLMHVLYF
jgi:hypothetical protein